MEIITIIGTGVSVVGLVYMFLINFKMDINKYINKYK
jgi:hypothetical protein